MASYSHSISKHVDWGEPRFDGKLEFWDLTPEQFKKLLAFENEIMNENEEKENRRD